VFRLLHDPEPLARISLSLQYFGVCFGLFINLNHLSFFVFFLSTCTFGFFVWLRLRLFYFVYVVLYGWCVCVWKGAQRVEGALVMFRVDGMKNNWQAK
jgi:hypothetical protein